MASLCPAEQVKVESSVPLIEEFDSETAQDNKQLRKQLCPYAAVGECRYGINCAYLHGDVCDMCGLQVLHPTDNNQRSEHTKVTVKNTTCCWILLNHAGCVITAPLLYMSSGIINTGLQHKAKIKEFHTFGWEYQWCFETECLHLPQLYCF